MLKFPTVAAIAALLMIPAAVSAAPMDMPSGAGGGGPAVRGGAPGPGAGPGGGGGPAGGAGRGGYVNRNVTVNRNVYVNRGGPVVGRRYHGGVWYGPGRHYWRGRWYAYGVGPCWLLSPIGYVWVCG
ncbi:MAG TPA: hypothetical protein VH934_13865 [Xanthobacteraceae bacterium]|jgi:hypothetical protein